MGEKIIVRPDDVIAVRYNDQEESLKLITSMRRTVYPQNDRTVRVIERIRLVETISERGVPIMHTWTNERRSVPKSPRLRRGLIEQIVLNTEEKLTLPSPHRNRTVTMHIRLAGKRGDKQFERIHWSYQN